MIARRWHARLSVALIATVCMLRVTAAAGSGELAVDIASLDTSKPGEVVAVVSVVDASAGLWWGSPRTTLSPASAACPPDRQVRQSPSAR